MFENELFSNNLISNLNAFLDVDVNLSREPFLLKINSTKTIEVINREDLLKKFKDHPFFDMVHEVLGIH
jgi:hypothetical protein